MEKLDKLRIIVYGKEALSDVRQISNEINKEEKVVINKVNYYFTVDNESSWEYLIFNSEINKENNEAIKSLLEKNYQSENGKEVNKQINAIIKKHKNDKDNKELDQELSKLLIKNRKFYDVLVIIIDNLLDEDSKSAFLFFQGFTQLFAQQPFILFLTKKDDNPNILTLFQFITNEFFDKRNVFAYKFPTKEEEKKYITNFFINSMNYYHEIGGNTKDSHSQTFNILICGPAGVGKSTFINQFLQEKRAKEGEGMSVTHEITSYVHSKYPIRIFDTPGFEGEETVAMVKKTLDKFEKDIQISKNHIDLIIYFCQIKPRTFYELETGLIESLITSNKKIIFVLNSFGNTKSECKKLKNVYEDSLKQIVLTEKNIKESELNEILKNIIVICLKQKYDEDVDEEEEAKIKIKQGWGLDTLFEKIYNLFRNDKILIHEIDAAKDIKEMIEVIQKYNLISYIKEIGDLTINIEIECSKQILSYSKYDKFVWFFRDKRRKELLQLINDKNNRQKIEDIDSLFSEIEGKIKKSSDDEKRKMTSEFFESMRKYKGIFDTSGFPFDAWFYNEYTFLVGVSYMNSFKSDYGKFDEQSKKFLKKLSESLNASIDSFKELADEWKEIYKSLKAHKSDKEWINKFFIVEVPKLND